VYNAANNLIIIQHTLIQRGGGTGPTKPRQPVYKVPNPAEKKVLEDERVTIAIEDCAPS